MGTRPGGVQSIYAPIAGLPWPWDVSPEVSAQPAHVAWPPDTFPGGASTGTIEPEPLVMRDLYDAWRWSELADHPKLVSVLAELKEQRKLELLAGGVWNSASGTASDRSVCPYRVKPGTTLPGGMLPTFFVRASLAFAQLRYETWPRGSFPATQLEARKLANVPAGATIGCLPPELLKSLGEMQEESEAAMLQKDEKTMKLIALKVTSTADGVDVDTMAADDVVAKLKPLRARVVELQAMYETDKLSCILEEIAAIEKNIAEFTKMIEARPKKA